MSKNLSIRHRAEKRFIAYGFISLILAATMPVSYTHLTLPTKA